MALAVVLLVFIYRLVVIDSLQQQVEQNNIIVAKTLSNVIWEQINVLELMPESKESLVLNDIYSAVIDQDIYKFLNGTPVLKVKFFNTKGKTIYSTDKKQIGIQKPANYPGSISAKTGKPISSLSFREKFESIDGVLHNIRVLATYIPTYKKNASNVDGVFEIYTDVTEPLKNIDNSLFNFTIVLLMVFAFVYGALYIMVRHADKVVLKNKDDLKNKIIEVEDMNTVLEGSGKELAAARDVANHANLSKSQFLANMSHELRTPLNAILGYTEIISEDVKKYSDEEVDSDLKKVHQAGSHLLDLINSILDLSKIEAGQMELHLECFNLSQLLQEITDTLKPIINKNHNLMKLDIELDNVLMFGDMLKIRQILFNLISNSAKFTNNGVITLKSRLLTINDEAKVVFEVHDSGVGIDEEHLSKLFDPFEQVDTSTTREYGGTGLGLTITKRFCTMMDGEIEVDSKKGKGTKFIVYLPYVDGSASCSGSEAKQECGLSEESKKACDFRQG
jgi:signal transduction histidine kinase